MAQYAYTFTSGDVVTPTKLNDARTVSDIVNADISATAAIAATKLASDSITNTQIKSDAAIAGTKIAPDFGIQAVQTSGTISVGAPRITAGFGATATSIQAHGTTGARIAATRWTADTSGAMLNLVKSRGASVGTRGAVQSGDTVGVVDFYADDGTNDVFAARILAQVDGTPGTNDMPGRLVFSTTPDGASSATERMRITSGGTVFIGKTVGSTASEGIEMYASGGIFATRSAASVLLLNRLSSDGAIVDIRQDSVTEGTISVSGTTVSYNGAHLSRWSQLPSGSSRQEILRGTVLSNIDEMCVWGDEQNEQLNRMKVSDVEGDANVSGVFQSWDDDDDTYTNDFYCAMTGDFVIRIAAGTTVQIGDLLMSAGDGTAKPQGDDIVRSKTVAKVTSTQASCTYADGSYCVPCVLMAC